MLRNSGGATREVAREWVGGACTSSHGPRERSFDDVEAGGIYWWMFVLLDLLICTAVQADQTITNAVVATNT